MEKPTVLAGLSYRPPPPPPPSPFIPPKKQSAIKIVIPERKEEVTFIGAPPIKTDKAFSHTVESNAAEKIPLAIASSRTLNLNLEGIVSDVEQAGDGRMKLEFPYPQSAIHDTSELTENMRQLNVLESSHSISSSEEERLYTIRKYITEPISPDEHVKDVLPPVLELVNAASLGTRSKFHQDCTTMNDSHWSTGNDSDIAYRRHIDAGAFADVFQVSQLSSSN